MTQRRRSKKQYNHEIEIEILSASYCQIKRSQARFIAPAITYKKSYWRQGARNKQEVMYDAHFFIYRGKEYFHFLTGHLRRILIWCMNNQIKVHLIGDKPSIKTDQYQKEPYIKNLTFRPDQLRLIGNALIAKRGFIKSPWRTGKTIIQYGLISSYHTINTLILAHTTDIVDQIGEEGIGCGFNVALCYGPKKDLDWDDVNQVVVMTRQTCSNLLKKDWFLPNPYFDMLIVDEAHHVSSPTGQYAVVLGAISAPLRFGFSATAPDKEESRLTLEGYIGPLIGELTIEEATKKEILVKPKIVLKKVAKIKIPMYAKYERAYDEGIVNNLMRNRLIAETAKSYINKGSSVLILVTKLRHGTNIYEALREISVDSFFVHGDIDTEERLRVKRALIKKEIMCVISTVVWKEGVNIPSLNVCINAAGGRSEIVTLQSVGRSLTKVKGKDHAVIVDFFDPSNNYLITHFGERINLYFEQGWM